eukprot:UN30468
MKTAKDIKFEESGMNLNEQLFCDHGKFKILTKQQIIYISKDTKDLICKIYPNTKFLPGDTEQCSDCLGVKNQEKDIKSQLKISRSHIASTCLRSMLLHKKPPYKLIEFPTLLRSPIQTRKKNGAEEIWYLVPKPWAESVLYYLNKEIDELPAIDCDCSDLLCTHGNLKHNLYPEALNGKAPGTPDNIYCKISEVDYKRLEEDFATYFDGRKLGVVIKIKITKTPKRQHLDEDVEYGSEKWLGIIVEPINT